MQLHCVVLWCFAFLVSLCQGGILHRNRNSGVLLMERFFEIRKLSVLQRNGYMLNKLKIDSGKATNCGPASAKLNFTWTPMVLNPEGSATFYADMYAPVMFTKGSASVDVYFPESSTPIFSTGIDGSCTMITKYLPKIRCPVKPKDHLQGEYETRNLSRIPTGNYTIIAKVTNQKKELFACINATFSISDGFTELTEFRKLFNL